MKRFYTNNYYRIVVLSWSVILFLLWVQYIYLSSLLEGTLFLLVLIPTIFISHILTNIWLPKALHRKRIKIFIFQFIGITFFIAFILAISYQSIRWAETEEYVPRSILFADDNSFLMDFLFTIPSVLVINFGFCGLRCYYEHIKLQKIHLETQLQVLQSQINPHFMFNILNHIHTLMQTNVDLASVLLLQYSDMLRFQLYKGKCDKVRLEEEIQFLKNFAEIEKLRWGERIHVVSNWIIQDKNMEIPPLLLISFIENAFKYASRTLLKQGFVKIEFEQGKEGFSLEVENSKSTISSKKDMKASGIGLDNTKKRLSLLYSDRYRLTIENKENTYYSKLEVWQI